MKINKSDAFASIKTNFLLIFSFLILVTGCNKSELGLSINLLSSSFHDYQNPILKSQFNTSLQTKAQLTSRKPSTSKEIERVLYDFRSEQAYPKNSSQQQAKIISTLPAEMRKKIMCSA